MPDTSNQIRLPPSSSQTSNNGVSKNLSNKGQNDLPPQSPDIEATRLDNEADDDNEGLL